MKWKPVTTTERARMRELRKQGWSLDRIGDEFGRPGRTVHFHVADIDVRCRPGTKGLGANGYARLLKAAEDGVSRAELAARFGLKKSSVSPTLSRLRRARRQTAQEACVC